MKFEQVLKMYWAKGFFFNSQVFPFNSSPRLLSNALHGVGKPFFTTLLRRFELNRFWYKTSQSFENLPPYMFQALNIIFSQVISINYLLTDLVRVDTLKLYLLKTTRGKAHALGQPSRGQRTWSNAWTAFTHNRITRSFIGQMQRELNKDRKDEHVNYKLLKKKTKVTAKSSYNQAPKKKKISLWF